MNTIVECQIKEFLFERRIKKRENLSNAFNMKCEKISLNTNEVFVIKYYKIQNENFNSIKSETNSLIYLSKIFPDTFPKVAFKTNELLIMSFIKNNNIKNKDFQKILANEILKIHKITNKRYGFDFDAQIGGLKQSNKFSENWLDFFREERLNMIFEKINTSHSMPKNINLKIEKLLNDLQNRIPKKTKISLLHGDLWSGNILFNDGKLVGFIDPGIYFGHNELEISYLTWFKYVDDTFLDFYSDQFKIDKYYYKYEAIYQLYFSLLNVYLWSREYIKDTEKLLDKII